MQKVEKTTSSQNSTNAVLCAGILKIIPFENQLLTRKVKNKFAEVKHLCYICCINKYKH